MALCRGIHISLNRHRGMCIPSLFFYFSSYPLLVLGIPWLGLVSLCQIWDFYGYSLKRGEVHNREEGEMARKSREEGEIEEKMLGGGRK